MEDYNSLINSKILDGYDMMLNKLPQETMFGGKRMRNFVLPGSTEYDYPGTLSVGTMDGKYSQSMGGSFYKDFNKGFPEEYLEGGMSCSNISNNVRRIGGRKKKLGNMLIPVAKELGMTLAKEGIKEGVKSSFKGKGFNKPSRLPFGANPNTYTPFELSGGKKKFNFAKSMKPLVPVAKELGMVLAKEALKEGVKSAFKPKKTPASGGVLIRDDLEEFNYPPELLASVRKMVRGKDAYGRGISKSKIAPAPLERMEDFTDIVSNPQEFKRRSHRILDEREAVKRAQRIGRQKQYLERAKTGRGRPPSARGAIVKEIMNKMNMTLGQASKFVKENNLY